MGYVSYRVFSNAHKKSLFNPKYSGHNISITIGMPTRNKLLSKRADQQATAPERVRLADGGQCGVLYFEMLIRGHRELSGHFASEILFYK